MNSNSTRIARNTFMLYLRQILIMLVSLFTVRMVLDILGAKDYGIYNVVASMVVFFTFLNGSMTSATQRFMNFALGQDDVSRARDVYSASFIIFMLIGVLVVILSQTVGLWFFYTQLNIPPERQGASFVVYQISIASLVIAILRTPYSATIIAYEKMSFFAFVSIAESLFRLVNVVLLKFINFDKLIVYVLLICMTEIIVVLIYKVYSNRTFEIAHFRFCHDKILFRQLLVFSGWSFFGSIAYLGRGQGTNVLINIFYGVGANAAMGIASQVGAAISSCLASFQSASSPQIIKSYSMKEYEYFMSLIFWVSKISFCLVLFFVLPLFINTEFVLRIWLNNVPEYTVTFAQLVLLSPLISAISGPLSTSIRATGDIKKYQLVAGCFMLACLPLSFFLLSVGFKPSWTIITNLTLDSLSLLWFIFYLGKMINLNVISFFYNVMAPVFIIAGVTFAITSFFGSLFDDWNRLFITCIVSSITIICLMYLIGLNKNEKKIVMHWMQSKIAFKI